MRSQKYTFGKKVILLLLLLFLSSVSFFGIFNINIRHEDEFERYGVKPSGYWNLAPFVIDDTGGGNYTWAQAVLEDWCTGSGTLNNPYVIENVTIDGNKLVSCLKIQNSDAHFKIQDCVFKNASFGSYGGIDLINTSNGRIFNNSFINNPSGIRVDSCSVLIIEKNYLIDSNDNGINILNSNYIQIIDNLVNFSAYSGVNLLNTNYSTVEDNEIYYCTVYGLYVGDSSHNAIINNYISINLDNGVGIEDGSINNSFSLNTLTENYYGIRISHISAEQNLIYNNYFINNTNHALDDGFNNHWNNSLIGNFWDNYTGVDADDDLIGDNLHDIPGTANSNDLLPIWDDGDDVPPLIIVNSPSEGAKFGLTPPVFNINIIDTYLMQFWYTINDNTTKYLVLVTPGINIIPISQNLWDSLPEGTILLRFYANDTAGYTTSQEISITKEIPTEPGGAILFGNLYLIIFGIIIITLVIIEKKRVNSRSKL